MSQRERKRMTVMLEVKAAKLTLVEAAEVLGLSYRQTKRVWRRYRDEGDKGLVHQLRGKPGARAKPARTKARILARYAQRYPDFGPTLAAEYLSGEGWVIDHETLRRWLLASGQRTVRRRRQRHRQWRERKPCLGAMVQLDGSHHDWFEGRRERCVLMVMVDDASNRVWAQFFEEETTRASYDMLAGWTRRQGLPQSLYVDRDSIYRCEGVGSIAEQLAGKEPQTQFGRAMKQLGVELILANSPQAKGRVERMNGVLHRAIPPKLDEILSWEEQRVVQRDWTVACQGKWRQLDRQHEALSLAGKKIIVRTLRDGRVQLERGGVKLRWKELNHRPGRVKTQAVRVEKTTRPWKPMANHPWRGLRIGRRRARLALGDSVRPPLRSGLSASPNARNKTTPKP